MSETLTGINRHDAIRSIRARVAVLLQDLGKLRARLDSPLGSAEKYQTGIAALGAGCEELMRLSRSLERGEPISQRPEPGSAAASDQGDLLGGTP